MEKVCGIAVCLNVLKSADERMWVESENGQNGRIKDRLLNKIILDIKNIKSYIQTYKRSSGIVFFVKKTFLDEKYVYKILQAIYTISRKNINLFNNHFGNIFKGSYGAEFSKNNILFNFNGHEEIIGLAINVAFKIAEHKDNQENMFVGAELGQYINHSKKNFNAVTGVHYPAYLKKIKINKSIKISRREIPQNNTLSADDGVIYFNVDIRSSTRALMYYDVQMISKNFLKILSKILNSFENLGFKSEFKGDGMLFWKHKTANDIKIYAKVLCIANEMAYSQKYALPLTTRKLKRNRNQSYWLNKKNMPAPTIQKTYKIRIGIDTAKKYFFIASNKIPYAIFPASPKEAPISPHRVLAEIAEKTATKKYKIVLGESFLQRLYMNHKDYTKFAKEINKYKLYFINNDYLKMSANNDEGCWKQKFFLKGDRGFAEWLVWQMCLKGGDFIYFGKEAREDNKIPIQISPPYPEFKRYNGLHFYINENKQCLQIFINDNKGGFKGYGK